MTQLLVKPSHTALPPAVCTLCSRCAVAPRHAAGPSPPPGLRPPGRPPLAHPWCTPGGSWYTGGHPGVLSRRCTGGVPRAARPGHVCSRGALGSGEVRAFASAGPEGGVTGEGLGVTVQGALSQEGVATVQGMYQREIVIGGSALLPGELVKTWMSCRRLRRMGREREGFTGERRREGRRRRGQMESQE